MANQLGKFSPNLAQITQPLRELLGKKSAWIWDTPHKTAFQKVKRELTEPTTLALYDPAADTKVSADASAFGLGAVLLQKQEESWKPVAYASRSLSETELRYAQIEKEALALTWACEKFAIYLLGKRFQVETDHKPLVPLLSSKHLDSLPPRVLRFRLRLDRFDFSIQHTPGKHMYTADTLSRAPLPNKGDTSLEELAELAMDACITQLPASHSTLSDLEEAQNADPVCSMLIKYCRDGWPGKTKLSDVTRPYWAERGQLNLKGNLLLFGSRIVIPAAKQQDILGKIHHGHQGIHKCRLRARQSVWWPGLSAKLEQYVQNCPHCSKEKGPTQGATATNTTAGVPMAKDWDRPIPTGKQNIPDCHRLLLTIPRGHHIVIHNIWQHHNGPQDNIRQTWHTTSSHKRQRAPVLLNRIPTIRERVRLPAHYQQPPLSPKQRAGGERSEDREEPAQRSQRPLSGTLSISSDPTSMVQSVTSRAANGTSHTVQHTPSDRNTHPNMVIPGEVSSG